MSDKALRHVGFLLYRYTGNKQSNPSALGKNHRLKIAYGLIRLFTAAAKAELVTVKIETTKYQRVRISNQPMFREAVAIAKARKANMVVVDIFDLVRGLDIQSAQQELGVLDQIGVNIFSIRDSSLLSKIPSADRYIRCLSVSRMRGEKKPSKSATGGKAASRSGKAAQSASASRQRRADIYAKSIKPQLEGILSKDSTRLTLRQIADELNAMGVKTARGKTFTATATSRLLQRLKLEK